MKWFRSILVVLLLFLAFAIYKNYPKLNILNGYAAKYMASSVALAGHQENLVVHQDLKMPLVEWAQVDHQPENNKANANLYGLLSREAVVYPGIGAILIPRDTFAPKVMPKPNRNFKKSPYPYPHGHQPAVDTLLTSVDYAQLEKAIALAFAQPEIQKTRTITILHKGYLIGEKYVDKFDGNTKVLGWSMTKSLIATCFGILQHQGRIKVIETAPIPQWQNDNRKNITLDHLLRMNSGLAWDENYDEISDVTRMLFLDTDMTHAQANKMLVGAPETIWNYSSGTTNLLSGVLRKNFPSHQAYLDFPYAAFLDKIGAHSFVLETDLSGHYVGSSYGWGSSYDWARVGQLYLQNGYWNGEQIFDSHWVRYITTPTPGSDGTYGAHFWLNAEEKYTDVPKDLYSLNGFQGQYVFIIPSKELVIVRTGLAEEPDFELNNFLTAVCKAIP